MLQHVFLASLSFSLVYSYPYTMIVTYGKPTNYTGYNRVLNVLSWEKCVMHCYNLPFCLFAYSPSSTPLECYSFYAKHMLFEVEKTTSANNSLVAFKVVDDKRYCPIGDNAPTFGNAPNYGSVSFGKSNTSYVITPEPGPSWKIHYNATLGCQYDWGMFTRPTTKWCIRVFGNAWSESYTQEAALAFCKTQNATLTGLDSIEERDFVAKVALTRITGYNKFAGFWVSGTRRPECYFDGWENIPYCTGANPQQFNHTDPYLTNYSGYTWDPSQPDWSGNCVQMWIRDPALNPEYDYPHGNSDDYDCSTLNRGFACGKLPELTFN
ncbi:hypothetical protein CAEBREN_13677 [Caenorhabditis brenneri]|uniref:C-type lectin domain-containing protein n=1 Tax=Caenorhabditis brenneri TaxID=135651 RepID=G0NJ46_CAEBE|nr:hypothetical protein CAEBREN_13677 [Caenorhabditis brenneri]